MMHFRRQSAIRGPAVGGTSTHVSLRDLGVFAVKWIYQNEYRIDSKKFNAMGADISFSDRRRSRFRDNQLVSIDVVQDKRGERFFLENPDDFPVEVLDVQPNLRHLLLLVRGQIQEGSDKDLRRFLCGHDERHWFVAAIPEDARVSTVQQGVEALKPEEVRTAQKDAGTKRKDLHRRKTGGYVRQGEWFFVPRPDARVRDYLILKDEPLRRGGGKPHVAGFLYRHGGESVYVCRQYQNGLTTSEYRELLSRDSRAKNYAWQTMRRDSTVLVKGRITHLDHATVILDIWHEVVPNTESRAIAFRDVAFLD